MFSKLAKSSATLIVALSAAPLHAQIVATWTGGGASDSYSDPANWDLGGAIPINSPDEEYRVVIPAGETVRFDVADPETGVNEVTQLVTEGDGRFTINAGRTLSVVEEATIDSLLEADGGTLNASSNTTRFAAGNARLQASGGGTLAIGATTLNASRAANDFVMLADSGSIDASTLLTLEFGASGRTTKAISAFNGTIDLSSLATASVTTGSDDIMEFRTDAGGEIRLDSLRATNQNAGNGNERVRFRVGDGTVQSTPSLESAAFTDVLVDSRGVMNLGDQTPGGTDLVMTGRSDFVLQPGATVNAPNLVLAEGAHFSGTVLEVDPLGNDTLVSAPRLSSVRRSTIHLADNASLATDSLSQIDDARIWVTDGVVFDRITDTDYLNTNFWFSTDLLRATGDGTLLDASTLTTMTFGRSGGNTRVVQSVRAADGGTIDLSGLTSLSVVLGQDDLLDVIADSGGRVDLSSLRSINGNPGNTLERVRFRVGNGSVQDTPSLEVANYTEYWVATGGVMNLGDQTPGGTDLVLNGRADFVMEEQSTVDAPNLVLVEHGYFTGGSIVTGQNESMPMPEDALVNAPRLSSVRRSTIHLADNASLATDSLSQIDDARIWVTDGVVFDRITDTDYLNTNFWFSTDLLRATGDGTLLDASTLTTMTFGRSGGNTRVVQSVRAADGGTIDLSGLTSLSVVLGQDDLLDVIADSGGRVDLSSLRSINENPGNTLERVRFRVGESSRITLGNVQSANYVELETESSTSELVVTGDLRLAATSTLSLAASSTMSVGGDLEFRTQDEAGVAADSATLLANGDSPQEFEVAGQNVGTLGATAGNFGFGSLVVGTPDQGSVVRLVDRIDNGNRPEPGDVEALYLYGAGLRLLSGSLLVLGDSDAYFSFMGELVSARELIGDGQLGVQFDEGLIVLEHPLLGDYDLDGDVDQQDYDAWVSAFGSASVASDGNRDGVVDAADYTIWRDAFHAATDATAVPEPSAVSLALGSWIATALGYRCRRLVESH